MEKEKNIIDVFHTLLKHRLFIVKYFIIVVFLALIISLVWPKTYKSTVRFLPPPTEKLSFGGLLNSIIQTGPSTSKLSSEAMLVILRSRALKERAIEKFDLDSVYSIDIHEYVLLELNKNMLIEEIREGGFGFNPVVAVELSFTDEEPWRAKELASFYSHNLDSLLRKLNFERLYKSYISLRDRYNQNLVDLKNAEDSLAIFQKKYGIYEVDTQLEEMVSKIADIKQQIILLEVEIEVLNQILAANSAQLNKLREEKSSLDSIYQSMLTSEKQINYSELFKPLNIMPELAKNYARLYRNVEIQNKILEFIYPQYEQLKLQVESDPLGIQIVDNAQIPTYKDKPKRLYIVLSGVLFAIFSGLLIIFIREYYSTLKETDIEEYEKIREIFNTLKLRKFFKG